MKKRRLIRLAWIAVLALILAGYILAVMQVDFG
jgi:hypothetical protein